MTQTAELKTQNRTQGWNPPGDTNNECDEIQHTKKVD